MAVYPTMLEKAVVNAKMGSENAHPIIRLPDAVNVLNFHAKSLRNSASIRSSTESAIMQM